MINSHSLVCHYPVGSTLLKVALDIALAVDLDTAKYVLRPLSQPSVHMFSYPGMNEKVGCGLISPCYPAKVWWIPPLTIPQSQPKNAGR